jgi:diguanylate cyclase (GGDEF)-like protein/PAS domain S-box-containing protein
MHSTKPSCAPPVALEAGASFEAAQDHARSEAGSTAAVPRPFVERRRRRTADASWQDALDCLQRSLVSLEKSNGELTAAETQYRSMFEEALVGIFQMTPEGRPLQLNRAMARIFGYESPAQFLAEVANHASLVVMEPGQWNAWKTSIDQTNQRRGIEAQVRSRSGEKKWVRANVRVVREEGRVVRYEGTCEDITDRKRAEDRNQFLAYYDALTGLPNRTLFYQRLDEAMATARWKNGRCAALLLELERFHVINDSFGERVGDHLLVEAAQRIAATGGATSIVARVGGAEFAVILPNVEDAGEAERYAERLRERLGVEFSLLGNVLSVQCPIGISVFPEHGRDAETMMKSADVAMRAAQEDSGRGYSVFTEAMNAAMLEKVNFENGLRLALSRDELFLVYQPQVDLRTGTVIGLEALVRWRHPQLGVVPPVKFIGLAESTGLIVPIGEWVLRTACRQAKQWQDEGLPPVPVAVNVSAIQFRQQGFRDLVRSVLHETGINPKYLELELTESVLLTNADVMFSIIEEFRDMGVMLAIDDFGTGYSSLGYLKQFKVNRLKIGRSFVQDIPANRDDMAITTAIIRMAKALNLSVLAEGVETEDQLAFLRTQQCYTIQGFYFSKPIAAEQIGERLRLGFLPRTRRAS